MPPEKPDDAAFGDSSSSQEESTYQPGPPRFTDNELADIVGAFQDSKLQEIFRQGEPRFQNLLAARKATIDMQEALEELQERLQLSFPTPSGLSALRETVTGYEVVRRVDDFREALREAKKAIRRTNAETTSLQAVLESIRATREIYPAAESFRQSLKEASRLSAESHRAMEAVRSIQARYRVLPSLTLLRRLGQETPHPLPTNIRRSIERLAQIRAKSPQFQATLRRALEANTTAQEAIDSLRSEVEVNQ